MPIFVHLPAGVKVNVRAVAKSSIQQQVTLTRSGGTIVAQWGGRGDGVEMGGTTLTSGSLTLPDTGVTVLVESRWDAPYDMTFVEEACVATQSSGGGFNFLNVNCDDRGAFPGAGSDHDYDDTVVGFWWDSSGGWSSTSPTYEQAVEASGVDMKKILTEALAAKHPKE